MKKLEKLKKNFVINTKYLKNYEFNQLIYVLDADKEKAVIYVTDKKGNISLKNIKIDEKLSEKTFITIKDFFKKCKLDDSEYKIEKVENGDIYLRVCYLGDLSLFYKLTFKTSKQTFILTNINKYKFYRTNKNIQEALNTTNINYLQKEKLMHYLKNLKNIKRDYIYSIKKGKEIIEKQFNKQNKAKTMEKSKKER